MVGRRSARLLLAALIATGLAPSPPPRAAEPPAVACSAETPSVAPGQAVALRAWAEAGGGQPLRYDWQAAVGRLEGRGARARWDLADLRPGTYAAWVRVSETAGGSAECVLRVIVRREPGERGAPPPSRETGTALLGPGSREAAGYGLYSYVLLGAPPDAEARERYLEAIESFRTLIPEIVRLEQYVPRAELNVAYLPVRSAPGSAPSAEWLLDHYDYARARSVLRHVPGATRNGPYLVSALRPLGEAGRSELVSGQYLFQDLSSVPPRLVSSWVKEFLTQAAQERFWDERTGTQLALRLRLTVGILGEGLPKVREALDRWISWVQ